MHCFKLMSKMAIMAVMFIFIIASNSFGLMSTYWDLGAPTLGVSNTGDTDQLTGIFEKITYLAQSSTTQYDTNGDSNLTVGDYFLNSANAYGTGLYNSIAVDQEGLGVVSGGYEFTLVLTDLLGVVQEIQTGAVVDNVTNRYLGGTIDMYVDTAMDRNFNGTTTGTGNDSGFSDGVLVATVSYLTGTGTSTFDTGTQNFKSGAYKLSGEFTFLLDGFWYAEGDEDLLGELVALQWLLGNTGGDVGDFVQKFTGYTSVHTFVGHNIPGSSDILYTIDADHDTSFELAAVPEPATCLLLGTGLLGLSGISRRRFKR